MKLQLRTSVLLLTVLLGLQPFASPAAFAASASEEKPFFYLMAHSVQVEGEARAYFTYRPRRPDLDQDGPLLLLVSRGGDGVLAWAQRTDALEAAAAADTPVVLLDELTLCDRQVLAQVLNEALGQT